MRTILVFGGAGFIGSHFVRYWRAQHPNDRIVIFDALTYSGDLVRLADIIDPATRASRIPQASFVPADGASFRFPGVDLTRPGPSRSAVTRSSKTASVVAVTANAAKTAEAKFTRKATLPSGTSEIRWARSR